MAAAAVSEPRVEEVQDEIPELETADVKDVADTMDARSAGKQNKKYAKAMAKLGLKPEPSIARVLIRRRDEKSMSFVVAKPEVYRFPNTNTFIIFGETQIEDAGADAQKMAARTVTGAAAAASSEEAKPAAAAAADDDEAPEDPAGIQDKEIDIVMAQASVSRNKAIRALKNNNGDIVNAIMELTMA